MTRRPVASCCRQIIFLSRNPYGCGDVAFRISGCFFFRQCSHILLRCVVSLLGHSPDRLSIPTTISLWGFPKSSSSCCAFLLLPISPLPFHNVTVMLSSLLLLAGIALRMLQRPYDTCVVMPSCRDSLCTRTLVLAKSVRIPQSLISLTVSFRQKIASW